MVTTRVNEGLRRVNFNRRYFCEKGFSKSQTQIYDKNPLPLKIFQQFDPNYMINDFSEEIYVTSLNFNFVGVVFLNSCQIREKVFSKNGIPRATCA